VIALSIGVAKRGGQTASSVSIRPVKLLPVKHTRACQIPGGTLSRPKRSAGIPFKAVGVGLCKLNESIYRLFDQGGRSQTKGGNYIHSAGSGTAHTQGAKLLRPGSEKRSGPVNTYWGLRRGQQNHRFFEEKFEKFDFFGILKTQKFSKEILVAGRSSGSPAQKLQFASPF
jgi:hypothetical protein